LNVRQTLAASLHEIAKMLADCSDVEDELVPVFEDMIQVIIMFAQLLYIFFASRTSRKFRWVF